MARIPSVRRRTVSLTHERTVKEVVDTSDLRIIKSTPVAPARNQTATASNLTEHSPLSNQNNGPTVLVVNASHTMAETVTLELTETLPDCTILFAPTAQIALWIVHKRRIDLIITSAELPDGTASQIHASLSNLESPPELLILSELSTTRDIINAHPGYRFIELRRVTQTSSVGLQPARNKNALALLGADIRNDLNNPLQEIVAMAFVATSSSQLSTTAEEALGAIQRAATSMASVINSLEDKIRTAVTETQPLNDERSLR